MSDHNVDELIETITPLILQMHPAGRAVLMAKLALELHRSQARRITQQRNPDGTTFQRRKNIRDSNGDIRLRMFNKIRTYRFLKEQHTADYVAIGFVGRIARIARVHQFGLNDRPGKGQNFIRYPKRELLGFSPEDIRLIERLTREFLQK